MARFLAYNSATDSNVTGDGTAYPIICNTEIFDYHNNYNSSTGVFTASLSESDYNFIGCISIDQVSALHTEIDFYLVTTQQEFLLFSSSGVSLLPTGLGANFSVIAPMVANDTAYLRAVVSGSTKQWTYWEVPLLIKPIFLVQECGLK